MEIGAGPTLVRNVGASVLLPWLLFFIGGKSSLRETLMGFSVCLMTFGALTVILEVGTLLHVVDYRKVFSTRIYAPARNPDYRLDRELIYIRHPHRSSRGSALGGDITGLFAIPSPRLYAWDMRYDQNGFRNETDMISADIAVIGDSFVEGPNVSEKERMSTILGTRLGRKVVNLGQIGYGPQQELVVLKRFGLAMRPSLIIWAFFEGNDLKNSREYEAVKADWEGFVAGIDSFGQRSFTKNALQAVENIVGHTKRSGLIRSCEVPGSGGVPERLYFLYPGAPVSAVDEAELNRTGEILAEAARLGAAQGAQFLVIFIPAKYRVFASFCRTDVNSELRSWTINNLPLQVAALAKDLGGKAQYLDLTPALVDSAVKGGLPYLSDDSHWSSEGHRVAAEAIITRLAAGK